MATLSITARTANTIGQIKTQALVALVPDKKTLPPPVKALDKLLGGTVTNAMRERRLLVVLGKPPLATGRKCGGFNVCC